MEDQLSQTHRHADRRTPRQRANKIARVSERADADRRDACRLRRRRRDRLCRLPGHRTAIQPPGAVFSFITALLLAYDPARRLARLQVKLERSLVNARMIYEILDLEPQPGRCSRRRGVGGERRRGALRSCQLRLCARACRCSTMSASPAAAGKTTAIVGGSGAGKSTLIALLAALLRRRSRAASPSTARTSPAVTKHSLRESIAYVSQQPYLFEGTIRDNIRYGRADATDAEIEEAASHGAGRRASSASSRRATTRRSAKTA